MCSGLVQVLRRTLLIPQYRNQNRLNHVQNVAILSAQEQTSVQIASFRLEVLNSLKKHRV